MLTHRIYSHSKNSTVFKDGYRPLGDIDIDPAVGLGPRVMKGIAGAVPAAEPGILGTEDLPPLAVPAGMYPITIVGKLRIGCIDDHEHDIAGVVPPLEGHDARLIGVGDLEGPASQGRVGHAGLVGGRHQIAHLHAHPVAGNVPVEAVIAVVVGSIMPIAPHVAFTAHEHHRRSEDGGIEGPGHAGLGPGIPVFAAAEELHKVAMALGSIVHVAAFIVRPEQILDDVPGKGVAASVSEIIVEQGLDIADRVIAAQGPAQQVIRLVVPGGVKARRVDDRIMIGQVFGNEILAGEQLFAHVREVLHKPPSVGIEAFGVIHGAGGVKPQAVAVVLLQIHGHVSQEEILDRLFPEGRGRAPGGLMGTEIAVVVVGHGLIEMIKRIVIVADVVIDHVKDHGQSLLVAQIHQAAQVFGAAVARFDRKIERRVVAPGTVEAEFLNRQQGDGVETQVADVIQFGLHVPE